MAWSGIGMNYGHQTTYDSTQAESDYTYLYSIGVTRVRIAMPTYSATTSITNCQDMVTRALNHGMYVVWGVATGAGVGALNATTWAAFKSYVTGTLAPWAQANGLPELCLGNEADYEADGTTLTAATVRSDVRAMATTVKSGGYTGKVSYSTTVLNLASWASEGIGSLDLIGFNSYDTLTNFKTRNPTIVADFGSKAYISEFGCITNGFSDYNDESAWYTDVINRVSSMQSAGVNCGYFFCYRDGGFGVTANTFALVLSNGSVRSARDAIKNVVAPVFSRF
jgi:hypothetical protein